MAILTLVFGRDILGTFEINKAKMIVGRAEDCDIVIDNLAVSRHHVIIEKKGSDLTVNDLDSNNGTFINGQRITGPTALTFGDEIGIGKHILAFDSHSKRSKLDASTLGEAQPDMDSPARGTMFVEPDKMDKMQKKVAATFKAHLKVVGTSSPNGLISLEKTDTIFGKSGDCDIKIKGVFASRHHAILSRVEKGFQLMNLAILSPTRVNGLRIEGTVYLCDGDEIAMGRSKFIFHSQC